MTFSLPFSLVLLQWGHCCVFSMGGVWIRICFFILSSCWLCIACPFCLLLVSGSSLACLWFVLGGFYLNRLGESRMNGFWLFMHWYDLMWLLNASRGLFPLLCLHLSFWTDWYLVVRATRWLWNVCMKLMKSESDLCDRIDFDTWLVVFEFMTFPNWFELRLACLEDRQGFVCVWGEVVLLVFGLDSSVVFIDFSTSFSIFYWF